MCISLDYVIMKAYMYFSRREVILGPRLQTQTERKVNKDEPIDPKSHPKLIKKKLILNLKILLFQKSFYIYTKTLSRTSIIG